MRGGCFGFPRRLTRVYPVFFWIFKALLCIWIFNNHPTSNSLTSIHPPHLLHPIHPLNNWTENLFFCFFKNCLFSCFSSGWNYFFKCKFFVCSEWGWLSDWLAGTFVVVVRMHGPRKTDGLGHKDSLDVKGGVPVICLMPNGDSWNQIRMPNTQRERGRCGPTHSSIQSHMFGLKTQPRQPLTGLRIIHPYIHHRSGGG